MKGKPTNVFIVGVSTNQCIPYREEKSPKLSSEKSLLLRRNRETTTVINPIEKTNNPTVISIKSILRVSILSSNNFVTAQEPFVTANLRNNEAIIFCPNGRAPDISGSGAPIACRMHYGTQKITFKLNQYLCSP